MYAAMTVNKFISTPSFIVILSCPGDLPFVDLMYYVMPMSESDSLAFIESVNSSIGSSNLRLVRIITLSLEVPTGEETIVSKFMVFDIGLYMHHNNYMTGSST